MIFDSCYTLDADVLEDHSSILFNSQNYNKLTDYKLQNTNYRLTKTHPNIRIFASNKLTVISVSKDKPRITSFTASSNFSYSFITMRVSSVSTSVNMYLQRCIQDNSYKLSIVIVSVHIFGSYLWTSVSNPVSSVSNRQLFSFCI